MTVVFIDLPAVLQIHQDQIDLYGGGAGVLDERLLQSALAMPQATFGGQWLHEFPHAMAAAYLFHIVANHPFADGNKRTGFATALAFLRLNGLDLTASQEESYEMVLAVARGEMEKSQVIEFFRVYVTR